MIITILFVAIILSQNDFFIYNFFARRVNFLPEISVIEKTVLVEVDLSKFDKKFDEVKNQVGKIIVPKYDKQIKSLDDKIGTLPDLVAERVMARFDLEPLEKMVKELKKQG